MTSGMEDYEDHRAIGSGTFGVVTCARNRHTGELVAIKRIVLGGGGSEDKNANNERVGVSATSLREIIMLKGLEHPNIVRLLKVVHSPEHLSLVFEYMQSDLAAYLSHVRRNGNAAATTQPQQPRVIHASVIDALFNDLCAALEFIHARYIAHRDIKPANLLVGPSADGKSLTLRLADFGLARHVPPLARNNSSEVVTLWYRCPLLLLGSNSYDTRVDLWSAACVLVEMFNLRPLFYSAPSSPSQAVAAQLRAIAAIRGRPSPIDMNTLEKLPAAKKRLAHLVHSPNLWPLPWSDVIKHAQYDPQKYDAKLNTMLSY